MSAGVSRTVVKFDTGALATWATGLLKERAGFLVSRNLILRYLMIFLVGINHITHKQVKPLERNKGAVKLQWSFG